MIIKFLEGFLDHSCKIVTVPKEIGEEDAISITPQLEYVPIELIHHIQSLLPAKDAARTCVLSKSWLHAWSTIPTLRFTICAPDDHLTKKEELQYIKLIDRTLLRYLNENLPINSIRLHLDIEKLSLPFLVENWFQVLASGNCLKELSLKICGKKLNKNEVGWLTIPDAIFSCENLNTINLRADKIELYEVRMNINPVIMCSFLRVLQLENVCISEGALHNLFSSCSLLEKVRILYSQHLKIIKVKGLRYLRFLQIKSLVDTNDTNLDICDVPSLRLISYCTYSRPLTMRMDTLRSVRELYLASFSVGHTFSDLILSKFPFLETLFLIMPDCMLETFEITCVSLKKVTLNYSDRYRIYEDEKWLSFLLEIKDSGPIREGHSLLFTRTRKSVDNSQCQT